MAEVDTSTTTRSSTDEFLRRVAHILIRIYMVSISPLFKPCCRFYPTCSQYALEAFKRFGVVKGLWLTATRLGRCHPFAKAGVDFVPDHFEYRPWRAMQRCNEEHEKECQ